MTPIDILYTPLDVPDLDPAFDVKKLEDWIKQVYPQKQLKEAAWTSVKELENDYPCDVDETGLRMYFENELPDENPLLIMPTKLPFTTRPNSLFKSVETPREDVFQVDKQLVCPVLKRTQAYYLNNVRAVHSPFINIPCKRISCFITPKWTTLDSVKNKTKELIVNSAIKFKDHALLWEPPE